MLKKLSVIAVVWFAATFGFQNSQAAGFDFSFSNETANLEIFSPLNRVANNSGQIAFGLFYNDLDDVVVTGNLLAVGKLTDTRVPYRLSFGGKAYVGALDEVKGDIGALAIGGSIGIIYPSRNNPLDLEVSAFFTPGITTFGDTESLIEIGARLSIEIVPQAKAFIGYRLLEIDESSNRTFELDDNVHFGIRLQF